MLSDFANPPVTLFMLETHIEALETAQQNVTGGVGGTVGTNIRNAARKVVEADLNELANFVENVAKGDVTVINKAGMPAKTIGLRQYDTLATPVDVKATSPLEGTVKLRWKGARNAGNYAVEHCPDPLTGTQSQNGNYNRASNVVIGGFLTGKKYWFRVRAMGSSSMMSDWSDPVCQLVS